MSVNLRREVIAREDGQMAIIMALVVLVIFMVGGLAFDAGLWYFDHRRAQNQADAAALAAVLELPASTTQAVAQADEFLERNGAQETTAGSCPVAGTGSHIEFEYGEDGRPRAATVCVRRQSPGIFSALAGIGFAYVSASAKAELVAVTVPYSLMAMDDHACRSFWLTGNGTIHVSGTSFAAGTYTRSDCVDEALATTGSNSLLESEGVNDVFGGANDRCDSGGQCTPTPTPQDYLEDPFAGVPEPPIPGGCGSVNVNNGATRVIEPGCYSSFQVRGTAILRPGVYVLRGGLSLSGNAALLTADINQNGVLDANEQVMFYVTCSSTCNGANPAPFSSSGQSRFMLQGIKGRPRYENVAIFVDRTAGPGTAVDLSGKVGSRMFGAIYALSSNVTITGNGSTLNLDVAVVADTLKFAGNGDVSITYDIELIPPLFRLALTE